MKTKERLKDEYYAGELLVFTPRFPDMVPHPTYPKWDTYFEPHIYEVSKEEYTPNSDRFRNTWKDFEHYKAFRSSSSLGASTRLTVRAWEYFPNYYESTSTTSRAGVLGFYSDGSRSLPFGEPGLPIQGLPGYHVRRSDGGFVPPPDDIDHLQDLAFRKVLPVIKSELSLVNSLIELKDFKTLPSTILKLTKNFPKVLNVKYVRGSQGVKGSLRSILGLGADGYLQAKFNILPLLSDIAGFRAALSQSQKRINDLVTRSGRVQSRHFTYKWREFNDSDSESSGHFGFEVGRSIPAAFINFNGFSLKRRVANDPTTFHLQIEYNYNYTQYQTEHAQLLGLLDAVGVNFNPAIIWNALPWSFVVDWVAGIGRWLDNRKVLLMEPKINILRCLWSVKRRRVLHFSKRCFKVNAVSTDYIQQSESPLPSVVESAYRRSLTSVTNSSIQLSGLNPQEFSLGAALVIARRAKPKRRMTL